MTVQVNIDLGQAQPIYERAKNMAQGVQQELNTLFLLVSLIEVYQGELFSGRGITTGQLVGQTDTTVTEEPAALGLVNRIAVIAATQLTQQGQRVNLAAEHLIYGILSTRGSLAVQSLSAIGANPDEMRQELETTLGLVAAETDRNRPAGTPTTL
jgi:hypothetical protein